MDFIEVWKKNTKFNKLLVNGKKMFTGTAEEFMNANFEIVEEKKTLSDKINSFEGTHVQFNHIYEKDVKEAIKEFIGDITPIDKPVGLTYIKRRSKEIFGERLV